MRKSVLLVIITTQDRQNAELLNIFFSDSVKSIKIPKFSKTGPLAEILSDPTLKAILKYKNHRSIVAIRNANNNSFFYFYEVSIEEVYEEIWKLSPRKSAQSTDISIRVLKENADILTDYICGFFNESIKNSTFPSILTNANITPVFQKGYKGSKENYRNVNIWSVTSKFFENYSINK